jgi:hypothetical protein
VELDLAVFTFEGKKMSRDRRRISILATVIILVLLSLPVVSKCSMDFNYAIWSKAFGGRYYDSGESIIEVDGGGFAVSGRTQGFDVLPNEDEAWLLRCDADGNHLWNNTYGGGLRYGGFYSNYIHSVTVIESADGGFLLTSHTTNYGPGDVNGWLIHTNQNGECLWNHTYGGALDKILVESVVCSEGGYLSVGFSENVSAGAFDGWVLRTDANGNHLWNQTYGSPDIGELFCDVIEVDSERFVITGGLGDFSYFGDRSSTQQDALLCCIDVNGTHLWNRTYGGTNVERLDQIIQCDNGDFAICGRTMSYGMGNLDAWLVRTDSNGELLWNQTYGSEVIEVGLGIAECQDGGFAIFTLTFDDSTGISDAWFVLTDAAGVELWDAVYEGADFEQFWSGIRITDGFIAVGITQSFGAGMSDMWITKIPEIPKPPPVDLILILIGLGGSTAIILVLAVVLLKDKRSE